MSDASGGRPTDVPDHPEPDPRLAHLPPPAPLERGAVGPASGYRPVPGPPPRPTRGQPIEPRRYPQVLRGPRNRWWKPLVTLALALAIYLGGSTLTLLPALVVGLATGVSDLPGYVIGSLTDIDNLGPVGFVSLNLSLILLIPTAMLSIWVVYGVRPRFLSSVTGRIRWRWLLRCLVVVVPIWVVYVGLGALVDPPEPGRPAQWVALLVIMVLLTPLQAAGEEYFFRGWLLQVVGSWFSRPVVGLAVATLVSAGVFSAAHGSLDIWIIGSIGCLAVAGCLVTWRTGGLEAAIAMHAVNNVLVFAATIGIGGWEGAFVDSETDGTPGMFLLALAVHGLAVALVWWQAGRVGLRYLTWPVSPAGAVPPAVPRQRAPSDVPA